MTHTERYLSNIDQHLKSIEKHLANITTIMRENKNDRRDKEEKANLNLCNPSSS